jgi:hypothetical protein
VPAQVVLDGRCKPAQVEVTIRPWNNKSGLTVPVLSGNFLQKVIREKCGEDADSRRVPSKELTRKGIDVVVRNSHIALP